MTAESPSGEEIRGQQVLLPTPPPGGFTAADLPRLIEVVDARFEILDGEVLVMAPATPWHNKAVDLLNHALQQVAPDSVVVLRENGIDLSNGTVAVPDVLVIARSAMAADMLAFQPADVRLAIEVVSPGSRTKDRRIRPDDYSEAGIPCFWRVENEGGAMVVHTFELAPEGGYARTGVFQGRIKVHQPFTIHIELPEVTW